jgi:hypothetical protein
VTSCKTERAVDAGGSRLEQWLATSVESPSSFYTYGRRLE